MALVTCAPAAAPCFPPAGLTRTLAAQTTHLLDEESDSQSDEEDDRVRGWHNVTTQQRSDTPCRSHAYSILLLTRTATEASHTATEPSRTEPSHAPAQ